MAVLELSITLHGLPQHMEFAQLQWWKVTKHIYSSTILKYNVYILNLSISIFGYFILLLHNSEKILYLFQELSTTSHGLPQPFSCSRVLYKSIFSYISW